MTITYRARPMTPAEVAEGWEVVLVFSEPRMRPVYLARIADADTFHETPAGQLMARCMGVTFAPAHEAH
jgi:hypothetical protein